ncbi:MAG: methylmalonyl-CoA carboxyltransferase [Nanoarchaeota archaeon]|nr:methylmalonyl-CoA carboxyltransferase [Nanoarchaeota archaeon]MBU1004643.1 methylmalonyl-CoA carboxyltransferase [Nanoarchaeota archaeon]MBU1946197.1 methylmalonyl-CoA carboxyltransferase [Nanoarchaeota archaeon]
MTINGHMKEFNKKKEEIELDKELVKKQHEKGKLTAEERLALLLDEGSFTEIDEFVELKSHDFELQKKKKARDGVIIGYGKVNKRPVCVYAQDFTFMGGSMGEMHNRKIAKVMDFALKIGCPVIGLFDSGGARIQEGINGLDGGGHIFKMNTHCSGVIPQISAILGPCAGIAVYSPALTDFVFMVDKVSYMFITGPDVIKSVTGEKVDFMDLGGANIHGKKSGVANFVAGSEKECILKIKKLLTYLPQNNLDSPMSIDMGDSKKRMNNSLNDIVPTDPKKSYDVKDVITEVVDKNSFFEVHAEYAQNCVVGFARLNNTVIGIMANQPKILAGCLDINSSDKIAKFVRTCDAFNIPLINFVDVTGFLPGTDQEYNGIIRHGAKILYAYSEATVPKISLVMRKAYGGAYIALVSKEMGYDYVLSWPMAEIAVMGSEQAVNILFRKEISSAKGDKIKKEKINEFSSKFMNPYVAAKEGKIDKVIDPKETRVHLINALEMLLSKREKRPSKKHGNIPL